MTGFLVYFFHHEGTEKTVKITVLKNQNDYNQKS